LWLGVSLKEVDKNMIQRISLLVVRRLTLGLTASSGWAETGDPAKGKAQYMKGYAVSATELKEMEMGQQAR
jgi:hypothetical protein